MLKWSIISQQIQYCDFILNRPLQILVVLINNNAFHQTLEGCLWEEIFFKILQEIAWKWDGFAFGYPTWHHSYAYNIALKQQMTSAIRKKMCLRGGGGVELHERGKDTADFTHSHTQSVTFVN